MELDDADAASSDNELDLPKLSDTFSDMEGDDLVLSDLDAILDEASLDSDEAEVKEELELELDGDMPTHEKLQEDDDEELEELSFELDANTKTNRLPKQKHQAHRLSQSSRMTKRRSIFPKLNKCSKAMVS